MVAIDEKVPCGPQPSSLLHKGMHQGAFKKGLISFPTFQIWQFFCVSFKITSKVPDMHCNPFLKC